MQSDSKSCTLSIELDVAEQLNKTTWQYLAKLSRQAAPTGLGLAERNKWGAFDGLDTITNFTRQVFSLFDALDNEILG